jgi:hypothetical protein
MAKTPQLTFTTLTPESKPEEVRKELVQRLRSGEYKQITGQLRQRRDDSPNQYDYCVLGVLTDLAVKAGVIKHFPTRAEVLVPKVRDWVGFRDTGGEFIDRTGDEYSLFQLNDNGLSFKKLAAIIKKEPEGLVKK